MVVSILVEICWSTTPTIAKSARRGQAQRKSWGYGPDEPNTLHPNHHTSWSIKSPSPSPFPDGWRHSFSSSFSGLSRISSSAPPRKNVRRCSPEGRGIALFEGREEVRDREENGRDVRGIQESPTCLTSCHLRPSRTDCDGKGTSATELGGETIEIKPHIQSIT